MGWRDNLDKARAEARKVVDRAETEIEKRGFDAEALVGAASDGLKLRNRKGEVKKWRVARAILLPSGRGRAALKGVGAELIRQRRAGSPATVEVGSETFDDDFFISLIDWAIEASGVPDNEEQRTRAAVRFATDGVDDLAARCLDPDKFDQYSRLIEEIDVDLTRRANVFLHLCPTAATALLDQLEGVRQHLVQSARQTNTL